MGQIMTAVSAQESSFHPRAAAATVADVMRRPLTTVSQHDHAAAAAYLMKHDNTGIEFRATYLVPGGGVGVQQERSRFVREGSRWYYLGTV